MKILKQGNIPEAYFTCEICGCEFTAKFNECEIIDKPIPVRCIMLEIACPCCFYPATSNLIIQH